jgi:hypothetical protein
MEIYPLIESIDLNPVFASVSRVVVGDARIMLRSGGNLRVGYRKGDS